MSLHRYTKAVRDELQTDGPSCPHFCLAVCPYNTEFFSQSLFFFFSFFFCHSFVLTLCLLQDNYTSSLSLLPPSFPPTPPPPVPLPHLPPPPPPSSLTAISAQFKTRPATRLDLHVRTRPTRLDSCSSTPPSRLTTPTTPPPVLLPTPYIYIYPPRIYPTPPVQNQHSHILYLLLPPSTPPTPPPSSTPPPAPHPSPTPPHSTRPHPHFHPSSSIQKRAPLQGCAGWLAVAREYHSCSRCYCPRRCCSGFYKSLFCPGAGSHREECSRSAIATARHAVCRAESSSQLVGHKSSIVLWTQKRLGCVSLCSPFSALTTLYSLYGA